MSDVLSTQAKLSQAVSPDSGAAGTSDINGATLDMQGFDGVLVACTFGSITGGATTSIKAQSGAESGMGDAADLAGTKQSVADTDDNLTFYIDLSHVQERYVRLVVQRADANAVVSAANYVQYKARSLPVSSHGSAVSGEQHDRPTEGTA